MPVPFPFFLQGPVGQESDRSLSNTYFFTLGVEKGESLFGVVAESRVLLNPAGEMVATVWRQVPDEFSAVRLDEFVVMPNHFHAIVLIEEIPPEDTDSSCRSPNLNEVIAVFKARTREKYLENIRQKGWEMFNFRLWEKGYFDHELTTRSRLEYDWQYLRDNPLHWARDWDPPAWLER